MNNYKLHIAIVTLVRMFKCSVKNNNHTFISILLHVIILFYEFYSRIG